MRDRTQRPPNCVTRKRRQHVALPAQAHNGGEPDPRDLKRAPWILWQGDPPAISFPGLLDRVVGQATRSPRALRYLIEGWLRDFVPHGSGVISAGLAIQRRLADSSDARMDPWQAAHSRFRLFDAADGPATLAAAILSAPQPVATVLEAACFNDQARAISGYLRSVQAELLERLPVELERPAGPVRLTRACIFLINGNALRFDDTHTVIAKILCKPWLPETARSPKAEVQREVRDFLVAHLGNPQLKPGRWDGAQSEAALIKRWLARASLKVFFELIAEHARDRHWKYREAFWSACIEIGAIDDAWLALGTRVHASARANQELGDAFGRMTGTGASASVLLLKVGPIVLAEWSHDGPLRAWPVEQAPKLGRRSYTRDDIVVPCLAFPGDPFGSGGREQVATGLVHRESERGGWQRRAALLLARHANVRLQQTDWHLR